MKANYNKHMSEDQHALLEAYLDAVLEKNQVMNLTAIRNKEAAWTKHILDSLEIGACAGVARENVHRIMDLGTGGGFPGVPLMITHPDKTFHFLDSSAKKLRFVKETL